jgi:hypothetical protein
MEQTEAMRALHAGDLIEAIATPADDANGWILVFAGRGGDRHRFTGRTGTEKVYHSLDLATEAALQIGFAEVRVEEAF